MKNITSRIALALFVSTITIASYADGTQCSTIKITTTAEDGAKLSDDFYLEYVDSSGDWQKYKTLLSKDQTSNSVVLVPLGIEQDIGLKAENPTLFCAYPESNGNNLVKLFHLSYNYSSHTTTITAAVPDTSLRIT